MFYCRQRGRSARTTAMSPANVPGKLSDRSPLQAVSLTNMGANKVSPPKSPHFQWVLLDSAPVQVKMCSVSLDLLHTCEFCDRDFASMERLMVLIEKNCLLWRACYDPYFFLRAHRNTWVRAGVQLLKSRRPRGGWNEPAARVPLRRSHLQPRRWVFPQHPFFILVLQPPHQINALHGIVPLAKNAGLLWEFYFYFLAIYINSVYLTSTSAIDFCQLPHQGTRAMSYWSDQFNAPGLRNN